jgi:hypothetical protein
MSVYKSLLEAASSDTQFQPKHKDETDQVFLHRLADVISGVPNPVWVDLSEDAKKWYDDSIDENDSLKAELELPEGYPVPVVEVSSRRRARTAVEKETTQPAVYDSLIEHVKQINTEFSDRHARETDQAFLARILKDMGETVPIALEPWVQAADAAQEAGKAIPLPEGYHSSKPKAATTALDVTLSEPAPVSDTPPKLTAIEEYNRKLAAGEVPPRRKRSASKVASEKPPKEAKVPGKRTGRIARPDSTTALIRRAVTRDQSTTVDDLVELLKQHGKTDISAMTVTTTRASHIAAMRALQAEGWGPLTQAAE